MTASLENIVITTGDVPTLFDARSSNPQKQELWRSAIEDELSSIGDNRTWELDENSGYIALPTHVVL